MSEQPTHETRSRSVEDFIKVVYMLQAGKDRVSTNQLRQALNITAPSVTDMAQRLMADGLVDYKRYQGVLLTPAGVALALRMIRRHRLIELYLLTELGYDLHEVHDEAERLEHAVSDRFIDALAHRLGDPQLDPHGEPIPTADGVVSERGDLLALIDLPIGVATRIALLKSNDPRMLQHMAARGIALDIDVTLIERQPFDGPVVITVAGETIAIGCSVAGSIFVLAPTPDA